jgi:hypothetical protein
LAFAIMAVAPPSYAEEMEMPNAAEVQYFSPEAQQFYSAGIAALDRADYKNAYNMLAKAAALQPASIRLNHITATLAIYHGRQNSSDLARDYYETALNNYQNILNVPTITGDLRRQVTNELKAAQQEAADLPQRDAIREATGTTFMLDWNRKYATQTPRAAGKLADAAPATTITQQLVNPITQMMAQDPNAVPGLYGATDPAAYGGAPAGMMPGAGMPGAGMPGAGMPGGNGMPGAPGMPGGNGMPGPVQPPAGVAPGGPGMGLPGEPPAVNGGQPTGK